MWFCHPAQQQVSACCSSALADQHQWDCATGRAVVKREPCNATEQSVMGKRVVVLRLVITALVAVGLPMWSRVNVSIQAGY